MSGLKSPKRRRRPSKSPRSTGDLPTVSLQVALIGFLYRLEALFSQDRMESPAKFWPGAVTTVPARVSPVLTATGVH